MFTDLLHFFHKKMQVINIFWHKIYYRCNPKTFQTKLYFCRFNFEDCKGIDFIHYKYFM